MNLDTIYIVRHGIAEDVAPTRLDADRRLTAAGIDKTRQAARGMKKIGVRPDAILTSPLRRADETARIVAGVLDDVPVRQTMALAPGGDFGELIRECSKTPKPDRVMVVGHQPDLGTLASWLTTGDPQAAFLPFRKAGIAMVEVSGSLQHLHGRLHWFLTPCQLRAIA